MTLPILIGCEYSATERDAFRARGFEAWSCDLKPTDGDPRWHIQGDIQDAIRGCHKSWVSNGSGPEYVTPRWSLIVLHVDCTAMAVCGNKHYGRGKLKHADRNRAIDWTCDTVELALAHADHVALENPASVIFPILRDDFQADVQYIQPWQHGHPEQKKTGLALWSLPRITPTNDVQAHMMTLPRSERERIFYMPPSADRGHERSRAYPGISEAMAQQWGDFIIAQNRRAA